MFAPGQSVLLVDGRGCHVEHRLSPHDRVSGGRLTLSGRTWAHLPFVLSEERTVDGLPVFRSVQPAIAANSSPGADRVYVPDGWHAPEELPRRLVQERADR